MKDHLVLTVFYAIAVGAFFGTLWRDSVRERIRYGALITAGLVVGAVVVAWLMALVSGLGMGG